ncbi:hypothetical protein BH24ACT5_BH24ACT5_22760 [soil metagenome]
MTSMYRSNVRLPAARRSGAGPAFTTPTGLARRTRRHRARCRPDMLAPPCRAVLPTVDERRHSLARPARRFDSEVYRRRRRAVGVAAAAVVAMLGFGLQALLTDSVDGPAAAA